METHTICDDNGIELLAAYDPDDHYLQSVEIVIAGGGIDITDHLTTKQKEHLISKIEQ